MNPIGRITWSAHCSEREHGHTSTAERWACRSTPRITIYDPSGEFVTMIDHPDDFDFMTGIVIAALKQVSVNQRERSATYTRS